MFRTSATLSHRLYDEVLEYITLLETEKLNNNNDAETKYIVYYIPMGTQLFENVILLIYYVISYKKVL